MRMEYRGGGEEDGVYKCDGDGEEDGMYKGDGEEEAM